MIRNYEFIKACIEWDVRNWKHVFPFWEKNVPTLKTKGNGIELGGRRGGLSLWLASFGHNVICTDIKDPEEKAKELHSKFKIDGNISYQTLNALDIGYKEKFDFVLFKSVMGGVSYGGKNENKQKLMEEIYESLKPGGYLMFCENLSASPFHQFFRKKFVKWGNAWNYLKFEELELLCSKFEDIKIKTYGFWGAMGRNELQRNILGIADIIFSPLTPKSQRYIAFVTAKKPL